MKKLLLILALLLATNCQQKNVNPEKTPEAVSFKEGCEHGMHAMFSYVTQGMRLNPEGEKMTKDTCLHILRGEISAKRFPLDISSKQ